MAKYHTKQVIDTVRKECKGEEMDACIMSGLTASDDEETEISMESSKCMEGVNLHRYLSESYSGMI